MDLLGIDRQKIDGGVLLNGFDKQSEIDVPGMDKIDALFDSDNPKWRQRIVRTGGESFGTMQLGDTLPMLEVVMMTICLRKFSKFSKNRDVLLDVWS